MSKIISGNVLSELERNYGMWNTLIEKNISVTFPKHVQIYDEDSTQQHAVININTLCNVRTPIHKKVTLVTPSNSLDSNMSKKESMQTSRYLSMQKEPIYEKMNALSSFQTPDNNESKQAQPSNEDDNQNEHIDNNTEQKPENESNTDDVKASESQSTEKKEKSEFVTPLMIAIDSIFD